MSKRNSKLFFMYLLIFSLVFSSFAGLGGAVSIEESSQPNVYLDVDPTSADLITVIVELEEESILEAKHNGNFQSAELLEAERQVIIAEISKVANVTVGQEYDYVFSGFSLEIAENELHHLLSIAGVKAVYENVEYQVSSFDVDFETVSPMMMDSAPFIGANDAWEAGFTGKGVTVAIIDTGVDYTHPDLAHAFGEYKGWDFVNNDADPQETITGLLSRRTNHGTHVAGTVAANGEIKGVAPDATLLAYRVLGPGGSGTTQNVIAGIERAVLDGADVMNLSLGNTSNNPDFATSIALDRAMADGVVAVTSNGNSGPNDWTVGSPGTSRQAISVGATMLPYNLYSAGIFTSEGVDYPSSAVMGYPSEDELLALTDGEFEFVWVGLAGTAADFAGKDLEGKIALMQRGDYAFQVKAENAKAHGAIGAVIFNNQPGVQPEIPGTPIPMIMTSQEDGQKLQAELEAGNNMISFDIEFVKEVGETMANFSSRGPVMGTWMIKPDVSAPGVAINSTVPLHHASGPHTHGYASLQGTSMAAPHVAGAAALILEAHPDWSVDFVKAALMNTAENLFDADGNLYPHNSQGAGSIRVLDAINTEILVTPGSHSFGIFTNMDEREVRSQSFTIHNVSNERKRLAIDFTGHEGIKVTTSKNLQIQPGRTQELNFNVQVDTRKLDPGFYEGTFILTYGNQKVEVPTIVFVQIPNNVNLATWQSIGISGGNVVGNVSLPFGADVFDVRIRSEATGELLRVIPSGTNLTAGTYGIVWDMTVNEEALAPGRYQVIAYVKKGNREQEIIGGTLNVN
ncbi:peptidase S8 [Anaerobacillus alkaliphilus]|uniref:Peptidase S8 n=1 Tax=Anaerobacillus alkaliphilus TaxID=1548597 RepID=A0A4Q0VNP8_9BACI|nr:S8 family serine peptidase [Anaerobacillus alkaliphilus]RXI96490.1 peptidase S8 [Anaerobacillus alkaliphilus]